MSGEGEVSARSQAMEAGALESKDASASEGGDSLKRNEAGTKNLVKKGKEASASQGFDILKKKKVMIAYRGVLDAHLAVAGEEAQPAEAGKKRMKVVKKRVSKDVIESIVAHPIPHRKVLEDDMFPQKIRRRFDWSNAVAEYDRALIHQYKALGYAEYETEVTDDEEEADDDHRGLKRKEASASSDGFDILKKKKVVECYRAVVDAHMPEEFQLDREKRMKVVKKRVPERLIKVMMAKPCGHMEPSEEHLGYRFLQTRVYLNWKNAVADYEKALINQYKAQGYAEDETEVTDDEEEMVES